ncbi:ankyrin repeat-containing protein [Moumouvirus maliensis]|nr:ankyrin repeat-containing protein [Moumouvirus maliensis]
MSNHYFNIRIDKPRKNRIRVEKKSKLNKKLKENKYTKENKCSLDILHQKYKDRKSLESDPFSHKPKNKTSLERFLKNIESSPFSCILKIPKKYNNHDSNDNKYPGATIIDNTKNNIYEYPSIYKTTTSFSRNFIYGNPSIFKTNAYYTPLKSIYFKTSCKYYYDFYPSENPKKIELYINNNKDVALLKFLLINFEEFKKDASSKSSLIYACKFSTNDSNYEIIKFLIDMGFDVNCGDFNGKTPLMYLLENVETTKSVDRNNIQCLKLLLNKGADINRSDRYNKTVFNYVIESKNKQTLRILEILLTNGLNPTTCLMKTMFDVNINKDRSIINMLLIHGANINFVLPDNTRSDIFWTYYYPRDKILNPFFESSTEWTILTYFLLKYVQDKEFLPVIKLLLNYGADYNLIINLLNLGDHWELYEIAYSVAFYKNYFKTIIEELSQVANEILFKPDTIRSKIICANLIMDTGGIFYDQILCNYFNTNDLNDLFLRIKESRDHI